MDFQDRLTRRLILEHDITGSEQQITASLFTHTAALEAEDDTETGQYNLLLNAQDAAGTRHLPALVLAEPDLQALTTAGLNLPPETDVQRPVTPAGEPAVVVGGRYVIGENPTDARDGLEALVVQPGDVVTVHGIDADGDADVTIDSRGGRRGWVDPRHLTPAPEPAAAPAVDDDLLRAVGEQVRHSVYLGTSDIGITRLLENSEVGQRLRAAWTAEAECDHWSMSGDEGPVKDLAGGIVVRFRCDGCGAKVYDDAALERLRVAQQLPDVGEATRAGDLLLVGNLGWPQADRDWFLRQAASALACVRLLDAEAADTSSGDEVRTLAVDLYDVGLHTVGPDDLDNRQLAERLLKLGWHRARGGQEAGR